MTALLLAAAITAATNAVPEEAFAEDASAPEILAACRAMIPTDVTIEGHINRRSRRGTEIAAYSYVLTRKGGETDLSFKDKSGNDVPFEKEGRLLDTDIAWSDIAMDFLWWDDVSFANPDETDGESLHGISCKTLLLKKGERAYCAWIDRRTGALLQAHEMRNGKTVREIFCTSLKKFDGKWAPKNIEVGPPGAKYRTKIVVETVK